MLHILREKHSAWGGGHLLISPSLAMSSVILVVVQQSRPSESTCKTKQFKSFLFPQGYLPFKRTCTSRFSYCQWHHQADCLGSFHWALSFQALLLFSLLSYPVDCLAERFFPDLGCCDQVGLEITLASEGSDFAKTKPILHISLLQNLDQPKFR